MKRRQMLTTLVSAALAALVAAGCAARCGDCGTVVKITNLQGVHFDFDRFAIKPEGRKVLDADVELLKRNRSLDISIEGHCDIAGSDIYNQMLSERRARAVYEYLLKNGVDASRMRTVGYGRTRPLASNDTPDGRARNRRVEIHVIKARP